MEMIDFSQVNASKKVLKLIADMQDRLLRTEDALEDIARASEIVEITGQTEILSTWREQANDLLKDRIVRPDTSVTADQHKMVIVTDDKTLDNKNVT